LKLCSINEQDVLQYTGGKLHQNLKEWEKITTDSLILDTIKEGLSLEFLQWPTAGNPFEHPVSIQEESIIVIEIEKLLKKKVIYCTTIFEPGDFCSGVFTRLKWDLHEI